MTLIDSLIYIVIDLWIYCNLKGWPSTVSTIKWSSLFEYANLSTKTSCKLKRNQNEKGPRGM